VVDGDVDDPAIQTGVENLTAALGQDSLYGPATVERNEAGDLTLVSVPMAIDPNENRAYDAVETLRESTIPGAFGNNAENVYVTGASAGTADFNTLMSDYMPIVFAFVLGLSFLLLMMAFRSLIVPLKAIVMNLLSVGAAYGVLVAVFQKGFLADTFGFQQTESIAAWLPIFLFCVLFGLSMDYHVFLLSRIREHFDLTHRSDESVAVGLQSTGRIITGAALIMVAVFGAFASGRLVDIQQMGLGLAVAVFLDATVVRSILVPAAMKLLGDWNWYLPRWLHWMPDLRIEGARVPAPSATTGD
jgi:putative drug exporter of the RND superfamily